ncbi:hypothetical protein [Flexivirga caeni]|nr:hypothetical protein [Flexivirga caeni]
MSNQPDDYDLEEEEVATEEGMPLPPGRDDANQPIDEPAERDGS